MRGLGEFGRLRPPGPLPRRRLSPKRPIPHPATIAGDLPTDRGRRPPQPPRDHPHLLTTSQPDRDLLPFSHRQIPTPQHTRPVPDHPTSLGEPPIPRRIRHTRTRTSPTHHPTSPDLRPEPHLHHPSQRQPTHHNTTHQRTVLQQPPEPKVAPGTGWGVRFLRSARARVIFLVGLGSCTGRLMRAGLAETTVPLATTRLESSLARSPLSPATTAPEVTALTRGHRFRGRCSRPRPLLSDDRPAVLVKVCDRWRCASSMCP